VLAVGGIEREREGQRDLGRLDVRLPTGHRQRRVIAAVGFALAGERDVQIRGEPEVLAAVDLEARGERG
jgi:hypothetical protein